MKKNNFLNLSLVLTMCLFLLLGMYEKTIYAMNNNIENSNNSIVQLIMSYMTAREKVANNGSWQDWNDISTVGVYNDELLRLQQIEQKGINRIKTSFMIVSTDVYDSYAEIIVKETITYDDLVKEVKHEITILPKNDGVWLVAADKYKEEYIDFVSCSYVGDESDGVEICASSASSACITYIATQEIGYLEKASNSDLDNKTANAGNGNYTKYGAWSGYNGQPWCHSFVSWCANQAKIDTSVIPKTASCDIGMQSFKNWSRFQYSPSYGGSYTPQSGDIIYLGVSTTDSTHVGIVKYLSGNNVIIVDGNSSDQVKTTTHSLSSSAIIGYGTPNYSLRAHDFTTSGAKVICKNCGFTTSSVEVSSQ